jgi:hypothetical protein
MVPSVNDSAVLLASSLVWPTVALLVSVLLLLTQRKAISALIGRIQKANFPGGTLELTDSDTAKIIDLANALPQDSRLPPAPSDENRALPNTDEVTPEQNREALDEPTPLPTAEVDDLVMLRTRIANLLSEVAFPPPPEGGGPISYIIEVLRHRGVLSDETTKALRDTVEIADKASTGVAVPHRLTIAAQNNGPTILQQISQLRATAPAKCEDHILAVLEREMPRSWTVEWDAKVEAARVDALVRRDDVRVVVEVRTKVHPGADGQVDSLRRWLSAVPKQLPVVLVLLGNGLNDRLMRQVRGDHLGEVKVLLWDNESSSLIDEIDEVLEQPRQKIAR